MKYCSGSNIFRSILYGLFFSLTFSGAILGANVAFAQKQSANLFFSAPPAQIKEGERTTIDVKINSPLQSINAISGIVSFPADLVRVVSINKDKSIINLWTQEPKLHTNNIPFEGVILNPGFEGNNGLIFHITLEAKKAGTVALTFSEGSVLANDGLGTNVLADFNPVSFNIIPAPTYFDNKPLAQKPLPAPAPRLAILPMITKYFPEIGPNEVLYIGGKGEPFALTKIVFENLAVKSLGEKFIDFLQSKKQEPNNAVVENDKNGIFHYVSSADLVAGVYNATPYLLDPHKNTELPGLPVQLLVDDSELVKNMVVLLDVMGLLIPILFLGVIIFFIPWYSWRKIRLMREKMLLEEEKIDLIAEELKKQNKIQDKVPEKPIPVDNY